MSIPLSQRIFGISGQTELAQQVEGLVERLRQHTHEPARRVIVAQLTDSVAAAQKLFESLDVHHLPVVNEARVVGIVSITDLLKFYSSTPQSDPHSVQLRDIMTPNPHVIRKDAPSRELVKLLAHARFHCVPVVNARDEIWDIVTTRDLVRYLELTLDK